MDHNLATCLCRVHTILGKSLRPTSAHSIQIDNRGLKQNPCLPGLGVKYWIWNENSFRRRNGRQGMYFFCLPASHIPTPCPSPQLQILQISNSVKHHGVRGWGGGGMGVEWGGGLLGLDHPWRGDTAKGKVLNLQANSCCWVKMFDLAAGGVGGSAEQ